MVIGGLFFLYFRLFNAVDSKLILFNLNFPVVWF